MTREAAPSPITSLTNPRVKAAVRLRDRAERDLTGLTIVDGAREILRALDAGVDVEQAFVARDLLRSPDGFAVADRLRHRPTTLEVSPAVLARVAFGQRSDGVVAVVATPVAALADLVLRPDPLIVVAETIEKPGNLGAIIRTADGAGADAIIAADPRTDLFNPNAIRASLGTIFALPVVAATAGATIDWLEKHGIRPVAARVDAPAAYTDVDLRGPLAIVLGSEAGGLSDAWSDAKVQPVAIPMHGMADSLNVSIAAAVLLYEARRQRG
ncbi:MAG TPA: TrmH family RNA methyltransferase [Candidatus Bathyarchaeia archaeon]|nr:TrmH family RNA methyltransferase [Candidatus Bathyarchaeia archaeon]